MTGPPRRGGSPSPAAPASADPGGEPRADREHIGCGAPQTVAAPRGTPGHRPSATDRPGVHDRAAQGHETEPQGSGSPAAPEDAPRESTGDATGAPPAQGGPLEGDRSGPGGGHSASGGLSLALPIAPGPSSDAGRGLVRLAPESMARLGLRPGDTVALDGGRRTHARVMPAAGAGSRLWAEAAIAANAGARWGEPVRLAPAELPALAEVRLLPDGPPPPQATLADALADVSLTEGDRLAVDTPEGRHGLSVSGLSPCPAGRVGAATEIRVVAPPATAPRYPGIAGLDAQIAAVHEMVELPLARPDLFERLGLDPPRGVLFTGPPGSGKTLLARAIAERTEAGFFHLAGPEIVSKHYGESERALREVFEAAARRAPAIVFLDEIDAIAPTREGLSGEKQVERRVVGQLLTLLDGLSPRERVVVIAATNLPDALDPALRRPGRLEREIAFLPPGPEARAEILALHLARAPLGASVDLAALAARCHGFTGADLAALAREAGLAALARARRRAGGTAAVAAEALEIVPDDLETARRRIRPSALRADGQDGQPPRWADIGGLDVAKAQLTEAVVWPLTRASALRRMRLCAPRGILLAGPPGTGKTLLVRALAAEAGMNFLPMRPAALLSQFLGEAERALAGAFRRARLAAPSLLFFDELDTLAPARGRADAAVDRIVAQLLTEMDGLEDNSGVTVIAATNRPDALDPALTRPGRFDLVVPVGLPDAAGRREVLAVHARGRPFAPEVDLDRLAAATEGASPAELAALMTEAARRALSRWRPGAEAPPGRPGDDAAIPEPGPSAGACPASVDAGGTEAPLAIQPADIDAALAGLRARGTLLAGPTATHRQSPERTEP